MKRIRRDKAMVYTSNEVVSTGESRHVIMTIGYDGTVSGGTVSLMLYDAGQYSGVSINLDSTDGDTAYTWDIGRWVHCRFSVSGITGGGTVEIGLKGV